MAKFRRRWPVAEARPTSYPESQYTYIDEDNVAHIPAQNPKIFKVHSLVVVDAVFPVESMGDGSMGVDEIDHAIRVDLWAGCKNNKFI